MNKLNVNAVSLKEICQNLKQKIPFEKNALEIYPDKIFDILDVSCKSLCEYIIFSNQVNKNSPELIISNEQLESIKSVFKELMDNFYPMAHTDKPLKELQIIDKESFLILKNEIENYQRYFQYSTIEFSEQLIKSVDRLMNP